MAAVFRNGKVQECNFSSFHYTHLDKGRNNVLRKDFDMTLHKQIFLKKLFKEIFQMSTSTVTKTAGPSCCVLASQCD